jgi:hypothetical protein
MRSLAAMTHHCFAVAERSAMRLVMLVVGLVFVVVGLGLGVTMIMLPLGLAVGFAGVGLVIWGVLGALPVDG